MPPLPGVVGHAPVAAQLEGALRDGVLPHATLLVGPEGVGKTTLAEALAGVALDATAWPGGLQAHPDHWLEDSEAERIGIDRVRAGGGNAEDGPSLQDFLTLRAYAGGDRVAVIGRADRLTEQAANSVLKTLEEPPPGTHVILCAAHPERLPDTILSRCQQFSCAPLSPAEIRDWLQQQHGVEPRLSQTAAALSGGRPGRALKLATEPGALRAEVEAIDAFIAAGGSGRGGALRAAGKLAPSQGAEGREVALRHVGAWASWVRDVACLASGAPELLVWTDHRPAAERWAEALPPARIADILGRCVDAADQLASYAIPRLTYEVLFLDVFATEPAPPHVAAAQRDPASLGPAGEAATRTTTPRKRPARRG
jgi:DNA polymerase III subunit delta'